MTSSQEKTKLWPMSLMNAVDTAQLSLYMIATSVKRHSLHNWIAHYPEQLTITYIKGR